MLKILFFLLQMIGGLKKNRMSEIESNFCLENVPVGIPKEEWKVRV